jgi:translation initiation factor 3 subunit C
LNRLRQKLKKYNKDFEKELADFQENPDNYPEEEKVASESESEGEEKEESETSSGESSSEESEDESGNERAKRPKKVNQISSNFKILFHLN